MNFIIIALLAQTMFVSAISVPVQSPGNPFKPLMLKAYNSNGVQVNKCVYVGAHPTISKASAYTFADCNKIPVGSVSTFRWVKNTSASGYGLQGSDLKFLWVDQKAIDLQTNTLLSPKANTKDILPVALGWATESPSRKPHGALPNEFTIRHWVGSYTNGCIEVDETGKYFIFSHPTNRFAAMSCASFYYGGITEANSYTPPQ